MMTSSQLDKFSLNICRVWCRNFKNELCCQPQSRPVERLQCQHGLNNFKVNVLVPFTILAHCPDIQISLHVSSIYMALVWTYPSRSHCWPQSSKNCTNTQVHQCVRYKSYQIQTIPCRRYSGCVNPSECIFSLKYWHQNVCV